MNAPNSNSNDLTSTNLVTTSSNFIIDLNENVIPVVTVDLPSIREEDDEDSNINLQIKDASLLNLSVSDSAGESNSIIISSSEQTNSNVEDNTRSVR